MPCQVTDLQILNMDVLGGHSSACPMSPQLLTVCGYSSWSNPWRGWQLKAICWPHSRGHKSFLKGDLGRGESPCPIIHPQRIQVQPSPAPPPFFSLKTTLPQLWIPAINSISDFITRVCFHLPLLWIIILCFYIYDQLFKVPLERLTTAQLSIIAIIVCLFVFRKQHRLGNVKTAFGFEQLCFGGGVSPPAVNVLHRSIFLSICSPAILQVTVNKTSHKTAKGLLLFPTHWLSYLWHRLLFLSPFPTPQKHPWPKDPWESRRDLRNSWEELFKKS